MPNKHPIVDPDATVAALNDLVDTINATGGVSPEYDDLPLEETTPTPVADEDWIDLAAAYALACCALGLPMQWAAAEESTSSAEPTEERAEGFPGAEPTAAELEALEAKARELNLAPSDLDDVIHDIASGVARQSTIRRSMSKLLTGRRRARRLSTSSNRNSKRR
jgi:hypothetical protein